MHDAIRIDGQTRLTVHAPQLPPCYGKSLRGTSRAIEEHARLSGFPANRITPVSTVIDPTTAN
ncbi:MAG: hypothetical protein M9908_03915 [Phyllobacteriaceae bacterium]|nr:hypothetical protein [Phyllobacteriaceae bacterium]